MRFFGLDKMGPSTYRSFHFIAYHIPLSFWQEHMYFEMFLRCRLVEPKDFQILRSPKVTKSLEAKNFQIWPQCGLVEPKNFQILWSPKFFKYCGAQKLPNVVEPKKSPNVAAVWTCGAQKFLQLTKDLCYVHSPVPTTASPFHHHRYHLLLWKL